MTNIALDSLMTLFRRIVLLSVFITLCACEDTPPVESAALTQPQGLVIAGEAKNLLFVADAGEDALQVLLVGDGVALENVNSEAIYFPLRIPVSAHPTALSASGDGRFVMVLSPVTDSVTVVDATDLGLSRDINGEALRVPVGSAGSSPSDILLDTRGCAAPCIDRFFVSLSGERAVAQLELREDSEALALSLVDVFTLPTAPGTLRMPQAGGDFIFAGSNEAQGVYRVNTQSGAVELLDVGDVIGGFAYSPKGDALLIGRRIFKDVVVFEGVTENPGRRALNSKFAPRLECLDTCGENVCAGAHPADVSICRSDDGLADSGQSYDAIYLGIIPAQIIPMGFALGHRSVDVQCLSADGREQSFSDFALVIGESGQSVYLRLSSVIPDAPVGESEAEQSLRLSGTSFESSLLSYSECTSPSVQNLEPFENDQGESTERGSMNSVLSACPDFPANRARVECVENDGAGVLVLPGRTGSGNWTVEWEGALPGLDRVDGGGSLDEDGNLVDNAISEFAASIEVGDRIEILSEAEGSEACRISANGASDPERLCVLERSVQDTVISGSRTTIILDRPIETACFAERNSFAYRVRVGGEFVIRRNNDFVGRIAPGERFGPSGDIVRDAELVFEMRDFDDFYGSQDDACERYDTSGNSILPLDPALSRDFFAGFSVNENLAPVRSGLIFDSRTGNEIGTVGTLPRGVALSRIAEDTTVGERNYLAGEVRVYTSFAGTDTIWSVIPHTVDGSLGQMFNLGVNYAVIR